MLEEMIEDLLDSVSDSFETMVGLPCAYFTDPDNERNRLVYQTVVFRADAPVDGERAYEMMRAFFSDVHAAAMKAQGGPEAMMPLKPRLFWRHPEKVRWTQQECMRCGGTNQWRVRIVVPGVDLAEIRPFDRSIPAR